MADDSAGPPGKAVSARAIMTFYVIALLVLAVDQLTKSAAVHLGVEGEQVRLLGPVVSFSLRHNTGAAWGLFGSGGQWLTYLTTAMVIGLFIAGLEAPLMAPYLRRALPLLLGGALGNLLDRLRLGAVVDFIDLNVWPVFNVADIAIVASAVLICYHLLLEGRGAPQLPAAVEEDDECDQS